MENLKPCPFCGNCQIDMFRYDPFDGYQGDCSTTKVFCRECGASVSASIEAKAITKWNRRPYFEISDVIPKVSKETLEYIAKYEELIQRPRPHHEIWCCKLMNIPKEDTDDED